MAHTIQETIELAVKTAILRAHPIGSYYLTEGTENPQDFIGGGWQKLTGRYVLQCSDDTHAAGTVIEAGLPDITGTLYPIATNRSQNNSSFTKTGAFINTTHLDFSGGSGDSTQRVTVQFKASRSNPIYGRSDTVQPPARIVNVWKRVS